ncbi:MAG: Hsp70 family protein [Pseudomonadota bacterium]
MDFIDKRYVVGIDLGTTNCAVAYVDLAEKDEADARKRIRLFNVPQLTGAGEFSAQPVLPSFLYIPGDYDVSGTAIRHPWKKEGDSFAGIFARDHGSKIPSRLVCSAKSWLCHARADREAKILPWGSEGVDKVSPVTATAEYLRHIRKAWNHSVRDEDLFLENQFAIITVPASFDEAAREFTLLAAKEAGFGANITLLEEPLAAFYSWLSKHETNWQDHVRTDDLILVCDVGGGTSDFTLITLKESQGSPRFERLAVGDHLILGGDNIDLALAGHVESLFKKHEPLSPDKWKTLCHSCRAAKERILDRGESSVRITLKGEGRSLISGTLAADLTREDLERILTSGFFPEVDPGQRLQKSPGKAIAEFGLPYEQEPAITRHIGWFLEKHRADVSALLGKDPMPDLILFNGGSLKPALLQDRIRASVRRWFGLQEGGEAPGVLENAEPDLAVALGAAYYGLVKQGTGVRVGSGSPRSYYMGIGTGTGNETPRHDGARVVCIVERGLDEGSAIELPDLDFEVLANQPVSFAMYSSSYRYGDKAGDVLDWEDSMSPMTPVHTVVKFGSKGEVRSIPVYIEPEYTELGTLAMWCCSRVSSHRWKLQFQLRDSGQVSEGPGAEIFDDTVIETVGSLIDDAFAITSDPSLVNGLVRQIEALVERKKAQWPVSLLRCMADRLIERAPERGTSADHEVRWLNLTGFCMRPGFGDAFDEERMRNLWKIYLSGLQHPRSKQNAIEWWVFMRRVAGGLKAGQQRQFFQDILSILPVGKTTGKSVSPQEIQEIWMAAANMERLLVKDKVTLARGVIQILKPGKTPSQMFWVLSRLGARELLYGSVDRVVTPREVAVWIRKIIKTEWLPGDPVAGTVAQLARKTGDRTRDLDSETVDAVVSWLKKAQVHADLIRRVTEPVAIEEKEESTIFGESLPLGLVLKH